MIERVCGCVCEIERDGENLELRELCSTYSCKLVSENEEQVVG